MLKKVTHHYVYSIVVPESKLDLGVDEVVTDAYNTASLDLDDLKSLGNLLVEEVPASPENLDLVPSWLQDDDELQDDGE